MKHQISIVIPILNEANTIKNLLQELIKNASAKNISEIIIVDGGSDDGSQEVVKNFVSGQSQSRPNRDLLTALEEITIKCINSEKGRAKQMNTGAKQASGDILYFLHADSFPPKNFDQFIISEVENNHLAGCFKMKFNSNHIWLKLAGWLTQFSWRASRGGDQSQFITKDLFNELNGFNEQFVIYEDNDLINKLYAINQFVVIQKWLFTSARRYESVGVWKLQRYYWTIYVKKWFGASAEDLHNYYLRRVNC